MKPKIKWGSCESGCGKMYLANNAIEDDDNNILCPHCGALTANWNEDWPGSRVRDLIETLKKLPLDAPLLFATVYKGEKWSAEEPSTVYCEFKMQEFENTMILRPVGEWFEYERIKEMYEK